MTGFCCCHGSVDRFIVTHLTKQNYIRTLTQCSAQCGQIIFSIGADFSLAYDTFLMTVKKFQRILQSNNMSFAFGIDFVYKTGKGGGFATTCRTCYQYQTFIDVCKIHDDFRNT